MRWKFNSSVYKRMSSKELTTLLNQDIQNSDIDLGRARGKRGRNEMPPEIEEVKQAELMKNRPRQDQVKLTGIAFGPSYQPATSSKEKPSKLYKRKHQIGSLLYDMKQKEMELAERRAKVSLPRLRHKQSMAGKPSIFAVFEASFTVGLKLKAVFFHA